MDYSNLQSRVSSSSYIPPHKTQIHPRMIQSQNPNPKIQNQTQSQTHKWIAVVSSLLTLPFVFYLFSTAQKIHTSTKYQTPQPKSYGIVMSCGASGARVRVFEFLNEGRMPFVGTDGSGLDTLKIGGGGLEGFGEETVEKLVEFARGRVPVAMWGSSKVQLLVVEGVKEKVLEKCRKVLRLSGFRFRNEWARIIKGVDEGVFAWVAANHALGTFGVTPLETTGIVELGGAAMQVVFALKDPPPKQFSQTVKFAGVTYNLYARSLPQYGQDAAWQTLQETQNSKDLTAHSSSGNPCLPRGYSLISNSSHMAYLPNGNYSACRYEVINLLKQQQGKCSQPPCEIISPQLVELRGQSILSENFFYINEYFGMVPKTSLSEVEAAGQHFCGDSWQDQKRHLLNINDLDLSRYCFSSAYTVALVHEILGIQMNEQRVGFSHSQASIPHDWTLGAFILQTMQEPEHIDADKLDDEIVGSDSITFFLLFSVLLIVVLAAFFILRWRRPQVKTVYDLEKGRYIITRVPR